MADIGRVRRTPASIQPPRLVVPFTYVLYRSIPPGCDRLVPIFHAVQLLEARPDAAVCLREIRFYLGKVGTRRRDRRSMADRLIHD